MARRPKKLPKPMSKGEKVAWILYSLLILFLLFRLSILNPDFVGDPSDWVILIFFAFLFFLAPVIRLGQQSERKRLERSLAETVPASITPTQEPAPASAPAPAPSPIRDQPEDESPSFFHDDYSAAPGDLDPLFNDAVKTVLDSQQASVSLLQRRLRLSYSRAGFLIDQMEEQGIISPLHGSAPRSILITPAEWEARRTGDHYFVTPSASAPATAPAPSSVESVFSRSALAAVDIMDGSAFEHWCAALLRKCEFQNVEVTKTSGDQGVDILAAKDGIKYAIQCKCYSSDLGNGPVQEVNTGKAVYNCHVGVVMTNRYFTAGAKEAAAATNVLLWDRDYLSLLLDKYGDK